MVCQNYNMAYKHCVEFIILSCMCLNFMLSYCIHASKLILDTMCFKCFFSCSIIIYIYSYILYIYNYVFFLLAKYRGPNEFVLPCGWSP